MIRYTFLAGAVMIATPAFAQQTATPTTQPISPSAPSSADPVGTQTTDPMQSAPTAPAQTQADASATTKPASSADQITQVVESDFPKYDADASGSLSAAEFGSWMTTLRASTDGAAAADSADSKKWLKIAFAQADVDKSKGVSKSELAGFLAKGKG